MTRHLASASRAAAAAAAALAAGLGLLACSSGEPANPAVDPGRDDTYVLATVTLLDRREPCEPAPDDCEPEFFDCETRDPLFVGETWTVRGDAVVAGRTMPADTTATIAISATDLAERTGLAIEFQIRDLMDPGANVDFRGPPAPGGDCSRPTDDINGNFVQLDALCARLNDNQVQESRFTLDACEPYDIQLTDWETDAGGALQLAQSAGGNEFSPSGIIEGTFSFIGRNLQSTVGGDIEAWVLVEGCFRVNAPETERAVPSNPTPPSSLCTP